MVHVKIPDKYSSKKNWKVPNVISFYIFLSSPKSSATVLDKEVLDTDLGLWRVQGRES